MQESPKLLDVPRLIHGSREVETWQAMKRQQNLALIFRI